MCRPGWNELAGTPYHGTDIGLGAGGEEGLVRVPRRGSVLGAAGRGRQAGSRAGLLLTVPKDKVNG